MPNEKMNMQINDGTTYILGISLHQATWAFSASAQTQAQCDGQPYSVFFLVEFDRRNQAICYDQARLGLVL